MVWGYRAAALGLWFADNLDIHQAYLEYDFGAAALRVGRQKFNLADQRLVASLEWANTARVYDSVNTLGARLVRRHEPWRLDLQSAVQFGDYDGLDHSAYMVHAGIEWDLLSGRWGVAYNLASGDEDTNDRCAVQAAMSTVMSAAA